MSVVAYGDTRCLYSLRPDSDLFQVSMVVLGTFMLWFGWIGFNGGCAFGANLRAIMAIWNTMIAAALGGMAWCLFDYRIGHKFSMVSFCSGTIAGLVLATSASGYISPWAALIMGAVAGILCNVATKREINFLKIFSSYA
jgi:ammonium transporter, Amt family